MLTQTQPLNFPAATIELNQHGHSVSLSGDRIGTVETDPVWGLTGSMYDTAIALGLDNRDQCFTFDGRVYQTIAEAAAQVIAKYLVSTAVWTMPDYM